MAGDLADDESAARLRAIVETAVDGIFTFDDRGTIGTLNPATERIFGYQAEELPGQNVRMLMAEPYHAEYEQYLQPNGKTGARKIIGSGREVMGRRKDGSHFPLDLSISETCIGDRRIFTGIARDVSERKRAEQALRRSEARLAGIIGSAMDAIITVNAEHRIVVFNAAAETMFMTSAADALGRRLDILIPERHRAAYERHVREFSATGVTTTSMWRPGVLLALRANGEEFPIEASISQVETGGEKLLTVILRDITERVRNEEAMLASKEAAVAANRSKDQFLAVMSHELRTPLNAIVGYVDLLFARVWGDLSAEQDHALDRVQHSAHHLLGIIEQVLQYARGDSGKQVPKPTPIMVAAVLRGVCDLIAPAVNEKRIRFEVELPPEDAMMDTDAGILRQIVLNLLSNAMKFTDTGSIRLRATLDDRDLQIVVRDTGVGISPDDQERVFDAFWQANQTLTRNSGGTGLGLSIVHKLAEALGGSVSLESQPGVGTSFTVTLPRNS
jgi:PAS domain S-box-containing protein